MRQKTPHSFVLFPWHGCLARLARWVVLLLTALAPLAAKAALPFTTNLPGLLQIPGGNLAAPLDFSVAVGANNGLIKLPVSASTNSLAGSINPKTGLLTVTFGNGRGKATTGSGAVQQHSTNADGAFLGTTNSGTITLQPGTR
jgi:hypothetical protein